MNVLWQGFGKALEDHLVSQKHFLPGVIRSRILQSAFQVQVSGHFTGKISVSPFQRQAKEGKTMPTKADSTETSHTPAQQSIH